MRRRADPSGGGRKENSRGDNRRNEKLDAMLLSRGIVFKKRQAITRRKEKLKRLGEKTKGSFKVKHRGRAKGGESTFEEERRVED